MNSKALRDLEKVLNEIYRCSRRDERKIDFEDWNDCWDLAFSEIDIIKRSPQ